jgi:hypothetical protein
MIIRKDQGREKLYFYLTETDVERSRHFRSIWVSFGLGNVFAFNPKKKKHFPVEEVSIEAEKSFEQVLSILTEQYVGRSTLKYMELTLREDLTNFADLNELADLLKIKILLNLK